jgi:predicted ATP-dependent protease
VIKAGSISKANGGYLVLHDRDVLSNAGVWEALQRVIKTASSGSRNPARFSALCRPKGCAPSRFQPTPNYHDRRPDVVSNPGRADPDFRETFKVKADFNFEVDRTQENITAFACFISDYCNREGLRHLDSEAVARVIEQAARQIEDQNKLSTRFSDMVDLLIESDYWAEKDQRRTDFRQARRARHR